MTPVYITANFAWHEVTDSYTATRLGFDNSLPASLRNNARLMADRMQGARDHLSAKAGHDCPMPISSWFRCARLNRHFRSSDKSDHRIAAATDSTCPAFGSAFEVATELAANMDWLGFGQVIYEGSWVHLGLYEEKNPINKILTIDWPAEWRGRPRTRVGILEH